MNELDQVKFLLSKVLKSYNTLLNMVTVGLVLMAVYVYTVHIHDRLNIPALTDSVIEVIHDHVSDEPAVEQGHTVTIVPSPSE